MKTRLLLAVGLFVWVLVGNSPAADTPKPNGQRPIITLWPEDVPGKVTDKSETVLPPRDNVQRVTNISRPTMSLYLLKQQDKPSPVALVCPGGGYRYLSFDKEGTEVAGWLNSIGVAAAVLKYRAPKNRQGALQDAQRAMGLLRHNAKKWNLDPNRIGIIGFSAGGHLAARLSTNHEQRAYTVADQADQASCRPDFTLLVYPAYLSKKDQPRELVGEVKVSPRTPPAFLVQAQDDRRYVDSSIAYYLALKKANVPAELHLFPQGGHGYGLRANALPVTHWPKLCETWLRAGGIIDPARVKSSTQR